MDSLQWSFMELSVDFRWSCYWFCRNISAIINQNWANVNHVLWRHLMSSGTYEFDADHYSDVIMSAMASQITGVSIACSAVRPGTEQRNYQSSASLAFVRGIHGWLVNSRHKGAVTRNFLWRHHGYRTGQHISHKLIHVLDDDVWWHKVSSHESHMGTHIFIMIDEWTISSKLVAVTFTKNSNKNKQKKNKKNNQCIYRKTLIHGIRYV